MNTRQGKLVSIVLPTHNGRRYLRQAIQSCLDQTYAHLELIIVNDGSTDSTEAIIREYRDERLTRISLPANQGLARALNAGFAQAAGGLLTWTSDDNFYAPEALECMVRFLEAHPAVDFVYADYSLVDEYGHVLQSVPVPPPERMLVGNGVGACFLYHRRVYEVLGCYNPECALAEDYEYWLRVLGRFTMKPLNLPLYFYRRHSRSLTGRHLHQVWRAKWRVQRIWLSRLPGISSRCLAETCLSLAYEAWVNGAPWEALRWLSQAALREPLALFGPHGLGRAARMMWKENGW
ncbi:MAG: glycosyltransferase [bacterium]